MSQSSVASEARAARAAFEQQIEAGRVSRTCRGACHAVDDRVILLVLWALAWSFRTRQAGWSSILVIAVIVVVFQFIWRPPIPLTTLR